MKVCQDTSNDGICDVGDTLIAEFTYDGDGKRVKSIMDSETILFIGAHYEFNDTTNEVSKYYFAGSQRVGMRTDGTLYYLLSDHLGTTSLAAWWTLNETSSTRYDSYSTNHLTDNNTVGYTAGKQGNAGQFVMGYSEYLSITDNSSLSMGAGARMTVCAWVKLNSKNPSTVQEIVTKTGPSNGTWEYFLRYDGRIDRFAYLVTSEGSSASLAEVRANTFGSPALGTWYFVCGGFDGANTWVSVNAGARDTIAFSPHVFDGPNPLRVGSYGGQSSFLDGAADEIILYKRSLGPGEINWLYNNGLGRTYADLDPVAPGASVTTLTYDNAGRKTSMSDPDMGIWTYTYDALGNLTSQTDARECTTNLFYDDINRLTQKTYSNCPATPTVTYY